MHLGLTYIDFQILPLFLVGGHPEVWECGIKIVIGLKWITIASDGKEGIRSTNIIGFEGWHGNMKRHQGTIIG